MFLVDLRKVFVVVGVVGLGLVESRVGNLRVLVVVVFFLFVLCCEPVSGVFPLRKEIVMRIADFFGIERALELVWRTFC